MTIYSSEPSAEGILTEYSRHVCGRQGRRQRLRKLQNLSNAFIMTFLPDLIQILLESPHLHKGVDSANATIGKMFEFFDLWDLRDAVLSENGENVEFMSKSKSSTAMTPVSESKTLLLARGVCALESIDMFF